MTGRERGGGVVDSPLALFSIIKFLSLFDSAEVGLLTMCRSRVKPSSGLPDSPPTVDAIPPMADWGLEYELAAERGRIDAAPLHKLADGLHPCTTVSDRD